MHNQEEMPGHLARRFQQLAVATFNAEIGAMGSDLTPVQYSALQTVLGHPSIDQASLASAIAYDRATITGVVDRLVKKGLLTRTVSTTDRRARLLHITSDGEKLLDQVQPAVDRAQDVMTSALTGDEKIRLIELLQKATRSISDE